MKRFSQKSSLNTHRRIHTGEKNKIKLRNQLNFFGNNKSSKRTITLFSLFSPFQLIIMIHDSWYVECENCLQLLQVSDHSHACRVRRPSHRNAQCRCIMLEHIICLVSWNWYFLVMTFSSWLNYMLFFTHSKLSFYYFTREGFRCCIGVSIILNEIN